MIITNIITMNKNAIGLIMLAGIVPYSCTQKKVE